MARAGAVKQITVVGGGAGGVELMLAMHHALNESTSKSQAQCGFSLITDAPRLLPAHPLRASAAVTQQNC